jgi:hypothetical protein
MRHAPLVLVAAFLTACPPPTPGPCTSDSQCSPSRCCAGKCVDVQTSATHCGVCSNACSAQNGSAKCTAGACAISCSSGFGDCNLMSKDGCETELASTTDHCGACGNACSSAHATNVCERSQCLQSGCTSGFGDCNSSAGDGCEVDLKSSLIHCGACGKKCEVVDGVGLCMQSACVVAACNAGFGDCDLSAVTGCETDLTLTDTSCGACGMACGPGYKCKASKCVAPELIFYGGLLTLQNSLATNVVSSFNVDTHAWSNVPTAGLETPGNRFAHLAVWDAEGKQMLVWGGYFSNNLPADTFVWSLDYSGGEDGGALPTWKKLVTAGGPTGHRGFMGWAWNKATRTLYVYGGTDADNNVIYDELWQFEAATNTWTQRTEPGGPGGLYQASMAWDSARGRLIIGQGVDDNFFPTAGFSAFDPSADGGGWSPLGATGAPAARAGAPFLGQAQPLQFWGGIDDFGDMLNDVYRLDALDGGLQWTLVQAGAPPPMRGYQLGVGTADRRFAFGGFGLLGGTLINHSDVWELSDDAGWTQIADGGVNFVHPGTVFSSAVPRE